MSTVTNSRGVEVRVYSTRAEAVNMEVVEPLAAGLDAGEEPGDLFDVEAIAERVVEWHTEWADWHGQDVEWLPLNGFCSSLSDDPDEFWTVVADHQREQRSDPS